MTVLVWDKVGDRIYETGVDRGVLYLPDSSGVAWNGLISVSESFSRDVKPYFLEGVKYLEKHVLGDFAAELRAFTYPDEFDEVNGVVLDDETGVTFHDQKPKRFGLSYRTLLGDDVQGLARGYKLHLVYAVVASPSNLTYGSIGAQTIPVEFSWILSGIPQQIDGWRPTSHFSIDSTTADPEVLSTVEDILYGTSDTSPSLPPIKELLLLLNTRDFILITDNEDGTWTADGPDSWITMLDESTFQIENANAEILSPDSYEISSTEE